MDNIFEIIGSTGSYQKLLLVLMGGISSLASITIYSTIFTIAEPKLKCIDENENNTSIITSNKTCEIWSFINKNPTNNTNQSSYSCSFDKTYYDKTIITDWNLICDYKYLANLTQTVYMIGTCIALFTGYLGDRFGRRKLILVALISTFLIYLITQLLIQTDLFELTFQVKYIIYLIQQFLIGLLAINCYCIAYILVLEFTIHKHHVLFSNIILYSYILGELIVLLVSYFIRDWKNINYFITAYSFVFIIPAIFLVKESPHLLIKQNKHDKAIDVLISVAKFNNRSKRSGNVDVNGNRFELFDNETYKRLLNDEQRDVETKSSVKQFFKEFLSTKRKCFQAFLLMFVWISLSLLYYGITLGITQYNDDMNPYLVYLFSCIAELVGCSLCFLNNKFGRRHANIFYLLITCVVFLFAFLASYFKSYLANYGMILSVILTLIGKATVTASYNTSYVYSAELYSTTIRSSVLLFLASFGRIGSLLSPQINLIGSLFWKELPFIIFFIIGLLSSLSCYILPDNKPY